MIEATAKDFKLSSSATVACSQEKINDVQLEKKKRLTMGVRAEGRGRAAALPVFKNFGQNA